MAKQTDALKPLTEVFALAKSWDNKPARRTAQELERHLKKVTKKIFQSDPLFIQQLTLKLQPALATKDDFLTKMNYQYPEFKPAGDEDDDLGQRLQKNLRAGLSNPFNISNFTDAHPAPISKLPILQRAWTNRTVNSIAQDVLHSTITILDRQPNSPFHYESRTKGIFDTDIAQKTIYSYWVEKENAKVNKRIDYIQAGEPYGKTRRMVKRYTISPGAPKQER